MVLNAQQGAQLITKLLVLGGPGSGWTAEGGHVPHEHKTEKTALKPSKEKAFSDKSSNGRLSKLETGALGEHIATLYLKQQGFTDTRSLNEKGNNFPVDLVHSGAVYEVKAGLASNGLSAQQWRATIGQPGPKEAAWLAKASDEKKAAWNEKKAQAIIDRKNQAVRTVAKQQGGKVKGRTVGVIIDPKRRVADIHVFEGFHPRIGWSTDHAKQGYRGSFKY